MEDDVGSGEREDGRTHRSSHFAAVCGLNVEIDADRVMEKESGEGVSIE